MRISIFRILFLLFLLTTPVFSDSAALQNHYVIAPQSELPALDITEVDKETSAFLNELRLFSPENNTSIHSDWHDYYELTIKELPGAKNDYTLKINVSLYVENLRTKKINKISFLLPVTKKNINWKGMMATDPEKTASLLSYVLDRLIRETTLKYLNSLGNSFKIIRAKTSYIVENNETYIGKFGAADTEILSRNILISCIKSFCETAAIDIPSYEKYRNNLLIERVSDNKKPRSEKLDITSYLLDLYTRIITTETLTAKDKRIIRDIGKMIPFIFLINNEDFHRENLLYANSKLYFIDFETAFSKIFYQKSIFSRQYEPKIRDFKDYINKMFLFLFFYEAHFTNKRPSKRIEALIKPYYLEGVRSSLMKINSSPEEWSKMMAENLKLISKQREFRSRILFRNTSDYSHEKDKEDFFRIIPHYTFSIPAKEIRNIFLKQAEIIKKIAGLKIMKSKKSFSNWLEYDPLMALINNLYGKAA